MEHNSVSFDVESGKASLDFAFVVRGPAGVSLSIEAKSYSCGNRNVVQ